MKTHMRVPLVLLTCWPLPLMAESYDRNHAGFLSRESPGLPSSCGDAMTHQKIEAENGGRHLLLCVKIESGVSTQTPGRLPKYLSAR
jgi:hypothetical protein